MMNINAYCIYEIHVMQILFALCSNTNLVLSSYLIQKHTWAFDGHTGSGFIHCRISQTWKTAILRGGVGTRPFVYEGLNSFVACPTTSRPYSLGGVRGPTTINCVRDGWNIIEKKNTFVLSILLKILIGNNLRLWIFTLKWKFNLYSEVYINLPGQVLPPHTPRYKKNNKWVDILFSW